MQRTASNPGQPEGLAKQFADLDRLDGKGLKERWRKLYGAQPPPGVSPALLVRAIAYRCKRKRWEGSSPPPGSYTWPKTRTVEDRCRHPNMLAHAANKK